MAMCPFATRMLLTEPKSFGKGQNGTIERIVVHHTGVKRAVTPTMPVAPGTGGLASRKRGRRPRRTS